MFTSKRSLVRLLEKERDRNARREAELLDRIMFLAGKEWGPPPRPVVIADPPEVDPVFDVDQLPDD